MTRALRWLLPLAGLAAAAAWWLAPPDHRLPEVLTVDELTVDVAPFLTPAPERADVRPNAEWDQAGGTRRGIVAPPGTVLRARVPLPPDAALRFAVAVAGTRKRDDAAGGVRFTVAVDGRDVWTRTVNPAGTRKDRRWFDERIDLRNAEARDAEVTLTTTAERPGAPLAGTAAWNAVRVLRTVRRDRQPPAPERPNVIVLLVDTLRADRLGAYGASPSPTPALDRFAAEGRVFEQSVSQAPWTLPSVASIMTGIHPRSHGVLGRLVAEDSDELEAAFLADAFRTLPEHAALGGITTVGLSANPLIGRGTNLVQGFETFVEYGWDRPRRNWVGAAEVNARFLAWVRANRDRRFLAYLQYMEPHDPYTPSAPPPPPPAARPVIVAGEIHELARKINWGTAPPLGDVELTHIRRLYDGEVADWDRAFGALRAALEAEGVWESTVVVVTSDHGESFQEHGRLTHGTHLYDELLRVPLVMSGPGIAPGRDARSAQGIDLYPTIARLLGLPAPEGVAGHDLLGPVRADAVVSETSLGVAPDGSRTELVSLRTPTRKLVHAPDHDHFELYALDADPGERTDLHPRAPDGTLVATLDAWRATAPAPPAVADDDAPDLGDKLRALGYVQ
jgi:arylsulfatase A-like enzyme